jgi:thiopeptide-type bacteriocin biosynthesis protein
MRAWVREQLLTVPQASFLREALLLASPDLVQTLPLLLDESQHIPTKRHERVLLTVFRYLLRMATRPTPFGLCAGVASGMLGTTTSITLAALHQSRTRTQPDAQFLFALIRLLEQRKEVRDQLVWSPNPLLFQDTRLILSEAALADQNQCIHMERLSLRLTPVLTDLLALTRRARPLAEVKRELIERYALSPEEMEQMLDQVCLTEILLSELRPPLTPMPVLDYLLAHLAPLSGVEDMYTLFCHLHTQCRIYDQLPPGQGYDTLAAILQPSEPLHAPQPTLAVDTHLVCTTAFLSSEVAHEIAHAAEFLCRLSPQPSISSTLSTYATRFQERYGSAREVPLLELLDEVRGLGLPPWSPETREVHTLPVSDRERVAEREQFLCSLAATALKEQKQEMLLSEEDIARLTCRPAWQEDLPETLDLFASIAASSEAALNAGEFLIGIGPRCGCTPAGRAFGRFADGLGAPAISWLSRLAEEEVTEHPDVLFAELLVVPTYGHAANVSVHPSTRLFAIPLGTLATDPATPLALETLLVGLHQGRFYIRSQEYGKEVKVRSTHLLNLARYGPPVARFLLEVAGDLAPHLHPFSWGNAASNFPFLPRLRMGRIVLSLAQWQLPLFALRHTTRLWHDPIQWYQFLQGWREEWHVPRWVWMAEDDADQRMVLDLENPLCVLDLHRICKRATCSRLCVQEIFPALDATWVTGEQGHHYRMEAVVPLMRVSTRKPQPRFPEILPQVEARERLRLPGSDWLSIKLYCREEQQDELLVGPVRLLLEAYRQEIRSFFVRYHDPSPHLRLRFQGDPSFLITVFFPVCVAWLTELVEQQWISHFVFEGYEREIERYGGIEGIKLAEALFVLDSNLILDLLALPSLTDGLSREDMALASLDCLLQGLKLSVPQRAHLFLPYAHVGNVHSEAEQQQRIRISYQQQRQRFLSLLHDPNWLQTQPGGERLATSLSRFVPALENISSQLHLLSQQHVARFLNSHIHMHCNRLIGKNTVEQDVRYYLARIYQQMTYTNERTQ